MIFNIMDWVSTTNQAHHGKRQSCNQLGTHLDGFFTPELLNHAGFVVVNQLPRPPLAVVQQLGLHQLLSPTAVGITLNDTYYLKPRAAGQLRVHFHELIHVLQWQELGAKPFIQRYLKEILTYGYRQAPLEEKAYGFEHRYAQNTRSPFLISASDTI